MKKYFFLFALLIGFTTVMAQANGGQEQRARQKAEAAARECAGIDFSGLELHSAATANLICDYIHPNPNYFGYQVEVWATPNCPPNRACIQIVYLVATVYVDCRGDVYDVQCYSAVPQ